MFFFSNTFILLAACVLVTSAPVPSPANDASLQSEFKRQDLNIPPGVKLATSSKEFVNFDASNFKRQDLNIPPGVKLATSSKEFVNFDASNFKRQDLNIPPGFKFPTSSKEFVNFDASNFKRLEGPLNSNAAEGSALLNEPVENDISKRQDLVIPPGSSLPAFGNRKQLLNLDTTDF